MRGLLVLVIVAVASPNAVAMRGVKPTTKDRADAAAFVAAAKRAHKAGLAAIATLPTVHTITDSTCGGAVAKAFDDDSKDMATFESLLVDASETLVLQRIAPVVATYARDLRAVHATDPVLKRYATYASSTMAPHVAPYAAVQPFDLCKLWLDWEAAGFKAGFDWITDAKVSPNLASRVETDFGTLGTPPALYNPIGNRLVSFGVRSSVAFWFPNAMLHAAGQ